MFAEILALINTEKVAAEKHTPNKKAVYVIVDKDMHPHVEIYENILNSTELRGKDYFSLLISMNKPVDSKKIIQSNNKYTVFVKDFDKLNEERLNAYYAALGNPEEGMEYKSWILNHIDYLRSLSNKMIVKVFFNAPLESYMEEGKKYAYEKVFNNAASVKNVPEGLGIPITINTNIKKPYLMNTRNGSGNFSSPYFCTPAEAYGIKCFLDIITSLCKSGYDKIYIGDCGITPVKTGMILDGPINANIYMHFALDKNGTVYIDDMDSIIITPVYSIKKIIAAYKKINALFFGNKLYDYMCVQPPDETEMIIPNKRETITLSNNFKNWFILGRVPDRMLYKNIIRRNLLQIIKNELGNDYELDGKRISLMEYLDKLIFEDLV